MSDTNPTMNIVETAVSAGSFNTLVTAVNGVIQVIDRVIFPNN